MAGLINGFTGAGRRSYSFSNELSCTNGTIEDFPSSAKAFMLHPSSIAGIELWFDGNTGHVPLGILFQGGVGGDGDSGKVIPFIGTHYKCTFSSGTAKIEFLY